MLTIGITGRSGVGKSTVAKTWRENNVAVADADIIAREVLQKNSPCIEKLQDVFGQDIFKNGTLDRKLLANRAFATPEGTKKLTDITHPEIYRQLEAFIKENEKAKMSLCAIDGAVLIGSICENLCSEFVVVTAPFEISVERIMQRDSISKEMAQRRLNAQISEETLLQKAKYNIIADSDCDTLAKKANVLLKQIKRGIDAK